MIARNNQLKAVRYLLKQFRVVALVGARQVGKTTLAREVAKKWAGKSTIFDLENPEDQQKLSDPMLALKPLHGLVIIDEIQYQPDLFPVLRVLADRPRISTRFLVLGSASPDLLRQSSESLAGRIAYHELKGFSLDEVGMDEIDRLWLRGGFPRSYTARSNQLSSRWRSGFIRSFLERDIPQLGINIPAVTLRRFWTMLAHYHGQIWNSSEFARSFGVSDNTVRRYLDILISTFVVRRLPPYFENLRKRQVKAPKIYLTDSGLLHSLLNLNNRQDIEGHPKVGASWEGFAMEEVIHHIGARTEECHFWATHSGAELDLLVNRGRFRWGYEFKRTVAPKITRSMQSAIEDLKLTKLFVLHAGETSFPLSKKIQAVSLMDLTEELKPLR